MHRFHLSTQLPAGKSFCQMWNVPRQNHCRTVPAEWNSHTRISSDHSIELCVGQRKTTDLLVIGKIFRCIQCRQHPSFISKNQWFHTFGFSWVQILLVLSETFSGVDRNGLVAIAILDVLYRPWALLSSSQHDWPSKKEDAKSEDKVTTDQTKQSTLLLVWQAPPPRVRRWSRFFCLFQRRHFAFPWKLLTPYIRDRYRDVDVGGREIELRRLCGCCSVQEETEGEGGLGFFCGSFCLVRWETLSCVLVDLSLVALVAFWVTAVRHRPVLRSI